ncbi:MAG: RNA polymerase subunit sigma-24 [Desulfuromonadales bacterium GWD2_61_12]|nr:MAG: RNA polymerase subunit sigma-24 [Desulfuromonadales bacterium GWC2_61_20]OGR36634.1 MAG: RNA polymerase subunit sigma-24 [Desulfuromonadales bacterium GWD2_61_12]HAD05219.1 RNA polymerase subunit sigma-24 [Desulfuromonas sp.]HBT82465.1 RNA polymerase subunit sigma-24 [Desulfuromonas sp.]
MHDFDSIYREFEPKIRRYLRHLVGENEAADLTQVVFLKVSRGLASFREEASLSTWIYRIATNTARDHVASAATRQQEREQLLVAEEESLDDFPDRAAPGTDHAYVRREMSACIRSIVDQLPESYRTVLLLGEFEGCSNPEIAAILDLRLETVKVRLHRARARLRQALQAQCSLYHDERNELMCDRKPIVVAK